MVPVLRSRAPLNFQTGKEWFAQQSPATQREMLGPGRAALWERGAFVFADLVTITDGGVWGLSTQVTSVQALQQRGA